MDMKYVALLRGIGPGNPSMQNAKLRAAVEELGYSNVQSVISSGNIIFETDKNDISAMESALEKLWETKLGFSSTTIIRSQGDLQKILKLRAFGDLNHQPSSYLMVTFGKNSFEIPFKLPYQPQDKPYQLLKATKNELFTVTDNTAIKTNDLMTWLEKQFGKEITSRTWQTVERIVKKLDPSINTK